VQKFALRGIFYKLNLRAKFLKSHGLGGLATVQTVLSRQLVHWIALREWIEFAGKICLEGDFL
jgi:hypothetical protein